MELSVGKRISLWEVVWRQRWESHPWPHCSLSCSGIVIVASLPPPLFFPTAPLLMCSLGISLWAAKTPLDKGSHHRAACGPFFGSRIYLEAISVGICLKKNLGWHLWWSKCNSNEAFLHLQHYIFAFRDIKSALARARALLHTRRIFPWAAGWVNKWKVQAKLILKKWIRSRLGPQRC